MSIPIIYKYVKDHLVGPGGSRLSLSRCLLEIKQRVNLVDRSINTWWSGQQMSTEQVLSISQRRLKNKKYDSLMVFVCLWLMVKTNIWLPHFCPRKRSVAKIEEINLLILGGKKYLFLLRPIKISSIFMTFLVLLNWWKQKFTFNKIV